MTRREFLQVSAASAAIGWTEVGCATQSVSGGGAFASAGTRGIRLRFLGSGSASWDEAWAKENPFMRRQSSVLLENRAELPEGLKAASDGLELVLG